MLSFEKELNLGRLFICERNFSEEQVIRHEQF